ncbi:hypothetical protein K9M47_01845 [Candidatus Gracilibacteria bacterium]|nr:hypothetical protein [Candidatus Gracilibacteria bacterium]MCF7898402.1 hypothetical protein [Candidatus Paceibacterota bacterium]
MHDIRKPYTRSSSNKDLNSRVEQFETRSYEREDYDERENGHVQIPVRRSRRNVNDMDMYPRRRMDDVRREDDFEEEYEEERPNRRTGDINPNTRRPRRDNSMGTWIFIGVIIVFAVVAGLFTYVFDSATVTIVPKYKDITDFNKTISFSKNESDAASVPYIVVTSSSTKSKTLALSESKKVESKASGVVIIYNNYDSSPQKLIKNTRLESTAGKIYRINQSVTVPGKKGDTPGSVEATVYADSNGASYNTPVTDFTIVGFKGTLRESGFYARGKGSIVGGASGNVSSASLSDINAAKDELALELAQEVKANLMKINKEGYIGLYGASEVTYIDNEIEVLNGTTGTYEARATGYLILADASKLAQSVAKNLRDYKDEPVRLGYTETLTYTRRDADKIASSTTLAILVEGKPRVIWVSDNDGIKEIVSGKKRDEFQALMKGVTTIQGAEISFSPLWLSTFPDNNNKIAIVESLPKR